VGYGLYVRFAEWIEIEYRGVRNISAVAHRKEKISRFAYEARKPIMLGVIYGSKGAFSR
jgi:hypothetical protein